MFRHLSSLLPCLVCICLLAGCYGTDDQSQDIQDSSNVTPENGSHVHDSNDKLVWASPAIEQDGFVITLGHHGDHFHTGDSIEPAAMITRDGTDITDAVVHNSMVAVDKETVLVGESKAVFEPKTDAEPAHYAQAAMVIPKGAKTFLIRFKIELPGAAEAVTHDISASVAH